MFKIITMKEPIYYYIRFRMALVAIAVMTGLTINFWIQFQKYKSLYEAEQRSSAWYARQNLECKSDYDMLIDLYTSYGRLDVIEVYIDRYIRWKAKRVRIAKDSEERNP